MLLLEAILFILSSGILFAQKFKDSPLLVIAAGLVALVSSIFLTGELWNRFVVPQPVGQTATALPVRLSIDPDSKIPILAKTHLNPDVEHEVVLAENAADRARKVVVEVQTREVEWDYAANLARNSAANAKGEAGTGSRRVLHIELDAPGAGKETGTYAGEVAMIDGAFRPHGFGEMQGANWGHYVGRWQNGKMDGPGIFSNRRGWQYKADFRNGDRTSGLVVLSRPDRTADAASFMFVGDERTTLGYFKLSYQEKGRFQIGETCQGPNTICHRIEVDRDGTIYAGQASSTRSGIGARFSPGGELLQQGLWQDGQLAAAYTH